MPTTARDRHILTALAVLGLAAVLLIGIGVLLDAWDRLTA